ISHTEADQTLAKLEKLGYVVDQNTFADDATYDNDTQAPQEFTIYLKHGTTHTDATSSKADQKTVNETIHYVYKDGVNANKPAAADYNTTVDFKRGYTTDNVTGKIVSYDDWTQTTKTFGAVKSPVIAGYTADQAEVAAQTVKPDSQNIVKTVYYTADTQEAAINFFDETNGKLLDNETIHLTGKTGEKISHTEADQTLAKLEKLGYVVDQNTFADDATYDNDTQAPQEFTIYLKHGTTHTDATSSKADQKTVSETIHYVYKDGVNANKPAAADYNTTVDFKRGYTTDNVTGKIVSYDDWTQTTKTFGAVKSPVIAGYTADQAEVAAQTVTPDSQNIVKTVYYTADTQEAAINFYDETDNKQLDNQTIHLTGKTGEKVDRTQSEKTLAELEKQGYVLDKENTAKAFPADATYDNDDVAPQEFTIYLKHGMTHTDATDKNAEQKIVTETIHYVYENNQTAKPDYTSAVDFKRGYTTDNVTGKVVSYDPWTVSSKKFGVVKSPIIEGYTPNYSQIDEITVTPDLKDVVKTVVYVGNAQEAQAIFYDETTGKEISGTREIATGKSDEAINFTKDPSEIVRELEAKGYVFDKSNANNKVFVDGSTYDKNSEVHQYFKYYFTHGHATVTPDQDPQKGQKTVTQTIKYEYADGTATGLADNVQTLTFKRTGDKDLVTHEVTWPDWSTVAGQQTSVVTSPALKGYTADTNEIPAITYHAGDSDVTYVVKYNADVQHAVINYIDGESDEILHTDKVNGHSDEKINYSTADMIKQLEAKGYELFKDNFPAGEKFDNDDKNDQTYTVIFKHHRENVDPNHSSADGTKGTKTLTETVHYKYANGTKAAEDQTAQVTFTRNGVLDDVTGIVAWGKWNEASQSYKALTSPTIAGYTPSEAVVKRSSNSDAEQGPTLTVIYTADAQKVHVQYIDGETDQMLRQDDLDGYTDETIPYSTAEGIKKFEGDGYELFKDNFPAGEKFDNDDTNDQFYTVIFKHHRENVDPNHSSADGTKGTKTLTETVHYKYANGTKAAEDQTAQVT
ncbi:mucin-binding protein, partial [Limosilactobacillus reuteri]